MKKIEIIEKMTRKSKQMNQVVIMMIILVILMNMTVKMMKVIYHNISFYIVFLLFS